MRAVPPSEKNGREIPVFGIVFVATPILSPACIATWHTMPTTKSEPNLSAACRAMYIPLTKKATNRPTIIREPIKPSSSTAME